MEALIKNNIDTAELKKFEGLYSQQVQRGCVGEKTQFDYAVCLVRSRYHDDMKKGVAFLEDLLRSEEDSASKVDYLFYLALGYTRLKDYEKALKYATAVSHIAPSNRHAAHLRKHIQRKMENDALAGMMIVVGAGVVLGGLVGLGIAALRK